MFVDLPGIGGAPLSEPRPLLHKPGRGGAQVCSFINNCNIHIVNAVPLVLIILLIIVT